MVVSQAKTMVDIKPISSLSFLMRVVVLSCFGARTYMLLVRFVGRDEHGRFIGASIVVVPSLTNLHAFEARLIVGP